MTEIPDEELDYLLKDHVSKGARYVPCFSQYKVLATQYRDNNAAEKWHYCHAFIQLPNYEQFTDNERKKTDRLFYFNGNLKLMEDIDLEDFSSIF